VYLSTGVAFYMSVL